MAQTFGLIMLNFGEPEAPTMEAVLPFLERIFYNNAPLERFPTDEARRARCRELAEKRAPGLIEDYARIGGSPLNAQAREEAALTQEVLTGRGHKVRTYVAMQFTDPTIADVVARAREDGVDELVALPIYPICGFSTNVAALEDVEQAARALSWDVPIHELTAWHHDAAYTRLRAENIRRFARQEGVDLLHPDTLLYFSAHGTPIKYLDMGSRYDGYVQEHCEQVAELLGGPAWTLGYQNHANRGIAWTKPDNEEHIRTVSASRLVVEPISFVHEQSETLAELDLDFRGEVEALGMAMHRVPTMPDRRGLATVLADLVTPFLQGDAPATRGLYPCRCRQSATAVCTNGHRDVPCHYARTSTSDDQTGRPGSSASQ